jgi:hypothetical protein
LKGSSFFISFFSLDRDLYEESSLSEHYRLFLIILVVVAIGRSMVASLI